MIAHNPPSVCPPPSKYSHGVETPPNARWLHTAGQVGRERDGSVPDGFEAQAELAWRNLIAVLESAGMGLGDVVKLTHVLTSADHIPAFRKIWDRVLGDHRPAATMLIVPELGRPGLHVEIEAIAAKA